MVKHTRRCMRRVLNRPRGSYDLRTNDHMAIAVAGDRRSGIRGHLPLFWSDARGFQGGTRAVGGQVICGHVVPSIARVLAYVRPMAGVRRGCMRRVGCSVRPSWGL